MFARRARLSTLALLVKLLPAASLALKNIRRRMTAMGFEAEHHLYVLNRLMNYI
jgi:hypothetical protein